MHIILIRLNSDFDNPNGALLGLIIAAFSIGAVIAIPVVPYVTDRFGRKHSITLPSRLSDGNRPNVSYLLAYLVENLMKDQRKDLFILEDNVYVCPRTGMRARLTDRIYVYFY